MYFLLAGADVNYAAANGHTTLGGAVYHGHWQTVEFLIKYGADVNKVSVFNWSPLYIAVFRGHLEIAKLLLKAGANPHVATVSGFNSPAGYMPLHLTAERGDIKMLKLLLTHGASPKKESGYGELPQELALQSGNKAAAALLSRALKPKPSAKYKANKAVVA